MNRRGLWIALLVAAIVGIVFGLYPQLDLAISRFFFNEAAKDFTYNNDDGQFNSGNDAPVADQVAEVQNASATKDEGGILALTGTNAMAAVGGAAVMLLIGLILMALTRKRRPGSTWQ